MKLQVPLSRLRPGDQRAPCVFMERFGQVGLNIRYLSPEVAMHHMVTMFKLGTLLGQPLRKTSNKPRRITTKSHQVHAT